MLDSTVRRALSPDCAAGLAAAFSEKGSLPTATMAACEADKSADLAAVKSAMDAARIPSTYQDRVLFREACVCISTRAAKLSAMGIAALLAMGPPAMSGKPGATIAVDGTVFEKYPWFKARPPHYLPRGPRARTRAAPATPRHPAAIIRP